MNFQIWWWHYSRSRRRWKNNLNKFKNHQNQLKSKQVLRGKGLSRADWIRKQVSECLARFIINKIFLTNQNSLHHAKSIQKIKENRTYSAKTKQTSQKRIKNKPSTETKQSSKKEKKTKKKNKKSWKQSNEK
jgi:hypothetical protein